MKVAGEVVIAVAIVAALVLVQNPGILSGGSNNMSSAPVVNGSNLFSWLPFSIVINNPPAPTPYPTPAWPTPYPTTDACTQNICAKNFELSPAGWAFLSAQCVNATGTVNCAVNRMTCDNIHYAADVCNTPQLQLSKSVCEQYCGTWHCAAGLNYVGCTR